MNRPASTSCIPGTRTAGLLSALAFIAAGPLFGLAGKGGKFEFAIDAPWRLEPAIDESGRKLYPAVPIQISIHDSLLSALDECSTGNSVYHLGDFVEAHVFQSDERPDGTGKGYPERKFTLGSFEEIVRTTGVWQESGSAACFDPPSTEVCRVWKDSSCLATAKRIHGTSEWHATFRYPLQGEAMPGTRVHLKVLVKVTRLQARVALPCGFIDSSLLPIFQGDLEFVPSPAGLLNLENQVSVYLGDEPLPRFDAGWIYGDLHYHSQGTDNEGESAYHYRGVLEAMGAMGLDFVFATEHASNSEQMVDADIHVQLTKLGASTDTCGLRDMSLERFQFLMDHLHGEDGANREVLDRPGGRLPQSLHLGGAVPQIFLGGEVDVIPELGKNELTGPFPYVPGGVIDEPPDGFSFACGDGLKYQLKYLCGGQIWQHFWDYDCDLDELLEDAGDRYLLRDNQGLNEFYHARQHLIYLPGTASNRGAFVPSNTEKFGGGSRLLFRSRGGSEGIVPEIERKKGYFFIAHPLNGFGEGNPGPQVVPYTYLQLRELFESPAFLGLQLWNEDTRLISTAFDGPPPMDNREYVHGKATIGPIPDGRDDINWDNDLFPLTSFPGDGTPPTWERNVEKRQDALLYHGAATWDRMNLLGLRARRLHWVPGCEPRKVFMAGGSDAHGDLNFRREGYFHGTDALVDTAIGKPRNLINAGDPKGAGIPGPESAGGFVPHSQEQVIEALREGKFCVTDGPALRISLKMRSLLNPTKEAAMGGVGRISEDKMSLLIEWISTPEFGPVSEVHLYLGVSSGLACDWDDLDCPEPGLVYAPPGLAPLGPPDELFPIPRNSSFYRESDSLRIPIWQPGQPIQYRGSKRVTLDSRLFPLKDGKIGDRFFARAFARTSAADCGSDRPGLDPDCLPRYAFTNPVWVIKKYPEIDQGGGVSVGSGAAIQLDLGPAVIPDPQLTLEPIPAAANASFIRGDANADKQVDISDAAQTLGFLFLGTVTLPCLKSADSDDNGTLQISDALRTLEYLFLSQSPPEAPYPDCGQDPTADALGCASFPACAPPPPQPTPDCAADLVITAFTVGEMEFPSNTDSFVLPVQVKVENRGSKDSGPFRFDSSHGSLPLGTGSLGVGETRTVSGEVKFDGSFLGKEILLSILADSAEVVIELIESNNRSEKIPIDFPDECETTVIDPGNGKPPKEVRTCWDNPTVTGKPDLLLSPLGIAGPMEFPLRGGFVLPVRFIVRNDGEAAAGPFTVAVKHGETTVRAFTVNGLQAGAAQGLSGDINFSNSFLGQSIGLRAVADSDGVFDEANESNNASGFLRVTFPTECEEIIINGRRIRNCW